MLIPLATPAMFLTIDMKQVYDDGLGVGRYRVFTPTLTRLTPSKVVFPVAFGGVLLRATMPVFLG
jgi:hypothetical protein